MVTAPLKKAQLLGGYKITRLLFRTPLFDAYSVMRGAERFCLLCRDMGSTPHDDEAFRRGIATLKRLRLEELPRVLHGGRIGRMNYIVTTSIGDTTPLWEVPGARSDWFDVVAEAAIVCEALYGLSKLGLFHGALVPQCIRHNDDGDLILVGAGMVRLFGLDERAVVEDPRYFAPEQFKGLPIPDAPTPDIWAFGMCIFGAVTGQRPFEQARVTEIPALICGRGLHASLHAHVPPELHDLILLCTSRRAGVRRAEAWEEIRSALVEAAKLRAGRGSDLAQTLEALEEMARRDSAPQRTSGALLNDLARPAQVGRTGDFDISLEDAVDFDKEPPAPRNAANGELVCDGSLAIKAKAEPRPSIAGPKPSGVNLRKQSPDAILGADAPITQRVPGAALPRSIRARLGRSLLTYGPVVAAAALFVVVVIRDRVLQPVSPRVEWAIPFAPTIEAVDTAPAPEARPYTPLPPAVPSPRAAHRAASRTQPRDRPLCSVITCGKEADE